MFVYFCFREELEVDETYEKIELPRVADNHFGHVLHDFFVVQIYPYN